MKEFQGLTARSWLQGRHLLPAMRQHGAAAHGTVLDLGCGNSPWRWAFPHADRYLRMDRYAADAEVTVIEDIYNLPLEAGAADTILLSRMLGDIPDQPRLWAELARVLAPGGRVLVYEAISYPQHDLPHDYWRVLPGGLAWAAGPAGLTLAKLVYCGGYATQLSVQLNTFVIGELGGHALTRPIAAALRALVNLACAGLDRLRRRPELASDYFACLMKTGPADPTDPAR